MTTKSADPLGIQPVPTRGDAKPRYDDQARNARADAVLPFFKTNYVEHGPQSDLINLILGYVRSARPLIGSPMDGRRLSEDSSAGKSRMLEQLVVEAAKRRTESGLPPNPFQIIVIELSKTTSVASFFRQILKKLEDPHWNDKRSTLDDMEERLSGFVERLGVDAIVGDEVQHLARKTTDAELVTDRLKTFLNRGIVPLVLVGDDKSEEFFKENAKFAGRLGTPLRLKPLDVRNSVADLKLFRAFCSKLDRSLVSGGIMDEPSGLDGPGIRSQLVDVSGGHVGRVCRVTCEAAQHALRRGSPAIERHDLSVAVREYAIGLGWTTHDAFSRPAG